MAAIPDYTLYERGKGGLTPQTADPPPRPRIEQATAYAALVPMQAVSEIAAAIQQRRYLKHHEGEDGS
jgi:hypothetical protein